MLLPFLLLPPVAHAAPTAQVTTIDVPIAVDGVLDESAWMQAVPVTDFVRYLPSEGGPPPGTTEVRFLQDERTLYVGIRVTGTARVRARLAYREDVDADDQIGLYLDPFGDAQTGYIFYTNAIGIQQDLQWVAGEWNESWNAVYRTKGRITDDGYELEIALPFRSVKYPAGGSVQDWGLILTRKNPAQGEKYAWPQIARNHPRVFAQAGALQGVRPPGRGSGLELIGGITVRGQAERPTVADDFRWSSLDTWWEIFRPSLDVRAGVTPTMALVGAVNPDFSQVEADVTPVLLNARFALQFAERRPLFTEAAGFFQDAHESLYTRSMVEPLAGLKLAGRQDAWSLGLMHVIDRSPVASVHGDGTPGFSEADVAGRWSLNTVVRIRRDLPRAGWFGVTFADKHLVEAAYARPDPWTPPLGGHDSLGLDTQIPLGRRWLFTAAHDQSLTTGGGDLFAGSRSALAVERNSGQGLGLSAEAVAITDDYRQELGFRTQSGFFASEASIDWTFAPGGPVSTVTPALEAQVFEAFDGESFRQLALLTEVLVSGVHAIEVTGALHQQVAGPDLSRVQGWNAGARYDGQVGAVLELTPAFEVGREMDFQTFEPALRTLTQLSTVVRPVHPLRIDLLGRWTHFMPEAGDPRDDVLVRGRIQWQFTPQWGLRLISEYNHRGDRTDQLRSSALLSWLLHPYTSAYLGYAEQTQLGTSPGTLDRAIFAKVQIMVRP